MWSSLVFLFFNLEVTENKFFDQNNDIDVGHLKYERTPHELRKIIILRFDTMIPRNILSNPRSIFSTNEVYFLLMLGRGLQPPANA